MCKYNIRLLIVKLIYHVPHHSVTAFLCDMLQTKTAYLLSSLDPSYQDNQLGLSQLASCWLAGSLSVNSVPLPEFPAMAFALADLC